MCNIIQNIIKEGIGTWNPKGNNKKRTAKNFIEVSFILGFFKWIIGRTYVEYEKLLLRKWWYIILKTLKLSKAFTYN